jgi:tripeptide aminopeptidase
MINRERLVQTFTDLVRIDSPSGHEEAVAQELSRRLQALGFQVARDAYGNVVASEPGDNPVLLSAHMDTVEPGRGIKPIVEGDRIHTDGSTILGGDCKAGLTAILEALASIKEDGLRRVPVQVAFTREEELGLVGANKLDFSLIRAKEAVVFDGEGPVNRITSASPTYLAFDVAVTGRAAHAGVEPEKGLSAIRIATEIIQQLPQGRLDPQTTFNVATIHGGAVRNAVPERASFGGEARSHDRESLQRVRMYIEQVLKDTRERHPDAKIEETFKIEFEAYALDEKEAIVGRVTETLRSMGLEPSFAPSGGGTDGNVFRLRGIQAIVMGVATHSMHTVREYVIPSELEQAAAFCQAFLTGRG